jgi:microcystin-dependent protein
MSFNFAPQGWAQCNGQLLPINQNQPLFALFGTTYGGDGRVNFALPDLRARIPIHIGNGHVQGERGGENAHTITISELPQHFHQEMASSTANGGNNSPVGRFIGGGGNMYDAPGSLTTMNPKTVANTGGSQAHENRQPYLALLFCVALIGIFPSQN